MNNRTFQWKQKQKLLGIFGQKQSVLNWRLNYDNVQRHLQTACLYMIQWLSKWYNITFSVQPSIAINYQRKSSRVLSADITLNLICYSSRGSIFVINTILALKHHWNHVLLTASRIVLQENVSIFMNLVNFRNRLDHTDVLNAAVLVRHCSEFWDKQHNSIQSTWHVQIILTDNTALISRTTRTGRATHTQLISSSFKWPDSLNLFLNGQGSTKQILKNTGYWLTFYVPLYTK